MIKRDFKANIFGLIILCIIIFFGLFYFIQNNGLTGVYVEKNSNPLLSELMLEIEALNLTLPQKIDEDTVLVSMSVINGNLVKKFKLPNHVNSAVSLDTINSQIIPHVENNTCGDAQQKVLVDNNIPILMKYFDLNDEFIFEAFIDKRKCIETLIKE